MLSQKIMAQIGGVCVRCILTRVWGFWGQFHHKKTNPNGIIDDIHPISTIKIYISNLFFAPIVLRKKWKKLPKLWGWDMGREGTIWAKFAHKFQDCLWECLKAMNLHWCWKCWIQISRLTFLCLVLLGGSSHKINPVWEKQPLQFLPCLFTTYLLQGSQVRIRKFNNDCIKTYKNLEHENDKDPKYPGKSLKRTF